MRRHRLFVGLNDKDLHKQVMTVKEVRTIIDSVLSEYGIDGYTLGNANGCYKGETEKTITVDITTGLFKNVNIKAIRETLAVKLNQNSIGYSNSITNAEF